MYIGDVLTSKGRRVVTARATKPLKHALRLMHENAISSIVVVTVTGGLLGIVTGRRLLDAFMHHERDAFDLCLADVMIAPPPCVTRATTVSHALRRMTEERVRHLVVVDGDAVEGIVSIGDLVKCRLNDFETETRVLRELALAQLAAT